MQNMLKPKMVFTLLSAWFIFHILIFGVMSPPQLEASIENQKGLFSAMTITHIGTVMIAMLGVIMFLCRELDPRNSKKILLGVGTLMVFTVVLLIRTNQSAAAQFPNDPLMQTPVPAVIFWSILTIYTLYVGVTTKNE